MAKAGRANCCAAIFRGGRAGLTSEERASGRRAERFRVAVDSATTHRPICVTRASMGQDWQEGLRRLYRVL